MDNWSYWKKPLKLHELLQEIEDLEDPVNIPENIVIFPPDNANNDNTDEDSGEEDNVELNKLPGSQLRADAEILIPTHPEIIQDFDSDDDLPLNTFIKKRKRETQKKCKVIQRSWEKRDIAPSLNSWIPVMDVKNQLSPMQLFFLFFDNEVLELLVHYSNIYAADHTRTGDITKHEMLCFIGILLLSGYVHLPRREMYWENSDDTHNKIVCNAIPRNRFKFIMQNLHCNNNNNLNISDKYSKIRPLFDALNVRFINFAPIEEAHSIDESMVPYYGRHGSKQFIRGKPIRWGYKLWAATTISGYIEWFDPYQGSSTSLPEKYKHLGLGASVVLQFADVLNNKSPNMCFDLYFDNFFTSPNLLVELKAKGLKGTGTVRENRVGKDCPLRHSSILKKTERGTFDYACTDDDELISCKWNDNNVVGLLSNNTEIFPTVPVKRFSQKEKKNIYVPQPNIIKKYNQKMGGVDRADQNISLYRVSIRGKKWYFPLMAHCIDMAEENAWRLHKHNGGKLNHLSFRRTIAVGLLESNKSITKRGPSRSSSNLHSESKYDRTDHLIIYQEKQTRCRVCHKKTNFNCKKCETALHPKDCFFKLSFHLN